MTPNSISTAANPIAPDEHLTFRYLSQVQARFRTGDRVWVCGIRLNPGKTRFIRNCPPMLAECIARTPNHPVEYLAPIKSDGQPDLKHVTSFNDIMFCGSRETAVLMYDSMLTEAIAHIQAKTDALQNFKLRLEAIKSSNKR